MTQQRRAHPRFDLRLSAEISRGEQEFTATTRNVSMGGCCVEAAYALTEEAELGIALFLVVDGIEDADMPPMSMRATVQWTAEADDAPPDQRHIAGLRFADITDEQRSWLQAFLKRTQNM